MDARDSESSTDDDFAGPLYGQYRNIADATEPASSLLDARPTTDAGSDTATIRSGVAASSPYQSVRSSLFSPAATAVSRPDTPSSPTLPSTFTSYVHRSATPAASASSPRASIFLHGGSSMLGEATLSAAEKDGDDPTIPLLRESASVGRDATPTALTRLLASRVPLSTSPSRAASYADGNPNLSRQMTSSGASTLHDHLFTRGLLEGKHSDIAVLAFGHRYNLHRLILDRAPFFTTALSEPWLESQAKEVALHPEEIDPTITQKAFELTLKRLYGCDTRDEEDAEAVGLFATGCWLEMQDLVDSSIESILRQMGPETLSPLIKLVTSNYYGRAGDRILASAKAMLCRDGWEMTNKYWDEIPGEIVREIVGGDGFYVPSEWDRWVLSKRLLDRRLKQKAVEYGLAALGSRNIITQAPELLSRRAIRGTPGHSRTSSAESTKSQDIWTAIYTDPDIEPVLVLMDEGIHYVHMDFERLQFIRQAKDVFGLAVLPDHVITNALWQQMELRQRVVNAREQDLELGLSQSVEPELAHSAHRTSSPAVPKRTSSKSSKGKQKAGVSAEMQEVEEESLVNSHAADQPRRFWIPSADCNIVMGGTAEPVLTTNATSSLLRFASGLTNRSDGGDMPRASLFQYPFLDVTSRNDYAGRNQSTNSKLVSGDAQEEGGFQPRPVAYSEIPPFRFAAEFPNPKSLKEKKRVYSRTVFYAGSHWNIYIQKVRSQRNPQLGVYLHRAKEREADDSDNYAPARSSAASAGSVHEGIGRLEREILLRGSDGRRAMGRRSMPTRHGDRGNNPDAPDDGSMAAYRRRVYGTSADRPDTVLDTSYTAFDSGDSDSDDSPPSSANGTTGSKANFFDEQAPSPTPSGGPSLTHFPPPSTAGATAAASNTTRPRSMPPNNTGPAAHVASSSFHNRQRTPALPPYTDARPTIRTYFKIYSPSKGGRLLSVYESAPDKFDFSQSWGWKSSTLMLDEGFSTTTTAQAPTSPGVELPQISITPLDGAEGDGGAVGGLAAEVERDSKMERDRRRRKEGALRFMVVIGNL